MQEHYLEFDDELKFLMSRIAGFIEDIRDKGGEAYDPAIAQAVAMALKNRLKDAKTKRSELG